MDAIQRDKCFARRLARSGCVKALGIVRVRDHDGMDLIFAVPQGAVSGNCDMTIDALMQGANS